MIPSSIAMLGSPCPQTMEAFGILSASLNGVACSTSWLWNMVVMLVSRAMTTEMPTDEPMLRMSVQSAAPSVRNSPGRLAKAIVLSGTKMKPRPNPCAIELTTIVPAETSRFQPTMSQRDETDENHDPIIDPAAQSADYEHPHECADAARAEQNAAREHRVIEQVLNEW